MKHFMYACCALALSLAVACGGNNNNKNAEADTASVAPATTARVADAQNGQSLFQANCSACHMVNQKLIGPPLKGVTELRSKDWIYNWVHNSDSVIKGGDTAGTKLYKEYNEVQMTPFPNLTNDDIDDIMAFIKSQE